MGFISFPFGSIIILGISFISSITFGVSISIGFSFIFSSWICGFEITIWLCSSISLGISFISSTTLGVSISIGFSIITWLCSSISFGSFGDPTTFGDSITGSLTSLTNTSSCSSGFVIITSSTTGVTVSFISSSIDCSSSTFSSSISNVLTSFSTSLLSFTSSSTDGDDSITVAWILSLSLSDGDSTLVKYSDSFILLLITCGGNDSSLLLDGVWYGDESFSVIDISLFGVNVNDWILSGVFSNILDFGDGVLITLLKSSSSDVL